MSSKYILGITICFILFLILCASETIGFPIKGTLLKNLFMQLFDLLYVFFILIFVSNAGTPPTFLDILISLSFNITVILELLLPASFNASIAIPPVNEPSPITAITWLFLFSKAFALAIPKATDIDVLLCPVSKLSYFDSDILGNP